MVLQKTRSRLQWLTVLAALVLTGACGTPATTSGGTGDVSGDGKAGDVGLAGDSSTTTDVAGDAGAETGDAGDDTAVDDASEPGSDVASDVQDDATQADVLAVDTSAGDTGPDVKQTDFHVVSTDPADGALGVANPFTFTVTFNDNVKAVVIGPNTVKVVVNGEVVDGTWAVNGHSFSFTSAAPVLVASRVDVTMSPLVQSEIGYALQNDTMFHFYVRGYDGMAPYEKLARRYAPNLRQGVTIDKFDRLRGFEYDGNAGAGDNASNIDKFPALPQVGWSVLETQSHWFITYTYFWPHRVATNAGVDFDNDAAGSIVTVAKFPAEHPVALTTWFKQKSAESMWMWVTAESGLPKASYVRGVYPEADLFPAAADTWGCEGIANCTPRRFPGYLTAGAHQSCLWLDAGDTTNLSCVNTLSSQAQLKWVDYAPGVTPTEPAFAANPGPKATYALYSTHDLWWPHRQDVGPLGWFIDASFAYVPPLGRPKGETVPMGAKFYNKDTDYSRPPWAWRWTKDPAGWYDMPAGTPFLDPAYAHSRRLLDMKNPVPDFDPKKKTGWSQDYCFHPYFGIDLRTSAACVGTTPP